MHFFFSLKLTIDWTLANCYKIIVDKLILLCYNKLYKKTKNVIFKEEKCEKDK